MLSLSQTDLYALTGAALFCIGLYGLVVRPHLLHKVLALNIMSAGVFLVLVGIARRVPGDIPDPLPHAMVLTGIVVTVSSTAFALALVKRIFSETGVVCLDDQEPADE
ncbi:MAG: cation:proton antiporter subunit C [Coriobacteriia bacterium]|nr:cation:proton antiporter subunit C [Coriobacteriia bacterium]